MWLTPANADSFRLTHADIDLGSCVLVSLASDYARVELTEPGVVIAVVQPGRRVVTPRAIPACGVSAVERYVIQCWNCRVVRRAAQMEVVWP